MTTEDEIELDEDGKPIAPEEDKTVDDLEKKIAEAKAAREAEKEPQKTRIKQLMTRQGLDTDKLDDDVTLDVLYEKVKGGEGIGIRGELIDIHKERSKDGTIGYVIEDHDQTFYSIDKDGNIYEWDAEANAYKFDTPVGNILNINLDGDHKAHVASAALLLDEAKIKENQALAHYQKKKLMQIEADQRQVLEDMGIKEDYRRAEIVRDIREMLLFEEDDYGTNPDKKTIFQQVKNRLSKEKEFQQNPPSDDLVLVLIANEHIFRETGFYPEYSGMYHDPDYSRNVELAIMSDVVRGAATGKSSDILAETGIKNEDMAIVAENYFTRGFHDLVDEKGGIPLEVDGSFLGEEYIRDEPYTRSEIKKIVKDLIIADAGEQGIPPSEIPKAMLSGRFCPHPQYLKWFYEAHDVDPDPDAGPRPQQLNEAFNNSFGPGFENLRSITGTFRTMINGEMRDVTIKDVAARCFMRSMNVYYPGKMPDALVDARNNGEYLSHNEIYEMVKDDPVALAAFEHEINNTLDNHSVVTLVLYNTNAEGYDQRKDYNLMRKNIYLPAAEHQAKIRGEKQEYAENMNDVGNIEKAPEYIATLPRSEIRVESTGATPLSTTSTPDKAAPSGPVDESTATPSEPVTPEKTETPAPPKRETTYRPPW